MTQEMANGTNFGELVFTFGLNGFKGHIEDFNIHGREAPKLYEIQRFVSQQLRLKGFQHGFYLTSEAPSATPNGFGPLPLVCEAIWSYYLSTITTFGVARPHRLLVNSRNYLSKGMDALNFQNKRRGSTPLALIDVVPPFFGYPKNQLDWKKLTEIANTLVASSNPLQADLRSKLWKHLLGIFPPSMTTRKERSNFYTLLCQVARELKLKWLTKYDKQDQETIMLYNAIKRDSQRTDPREAFLRQTSGDEGISPHHTNNISCLTNVVMTYCEEHRKVAYTQGMTDLAAPILFVLIQQRQDNTVYSLEEEVYVLYSAFMRYLRSNFTRHCRGALERVEALRHLCEVFDPDLYQHLSSFPDDAFGLCFGMVLIDCHREFPFADSLHLMEVVICSHFDPKAPMDESHVQWAESITTESPDVLHHVINGDVPLSITRSLGDHHPAQKQRCYSKRSAHGYSVTQLPSEDPDIQSDEEDNLSLLEAERVSPFRPFDDDLGRSLNHHQGPLTQEEQFTVSMRSDVSVELQAIGDIDITVKQSYVVFICLGVLIYLRDAILRSPDFVAFSILLKEKEGTHSLEHILCLARDLLMQYKQYQREVFPGDHPKTWLHQFNQD